MIDWDSLWGGAKQAVEQGLDQFKQVGVPVIQASIEQWGIETLQKQHEATTGKLTENIKAMQEQPSSAIGEAFERVMKDQAIGLYGHWVILGVAAAGVVGFLLLRK